jgi:hypothetical protein
MAKKQTRRTFSLCRPMYDALAARAEQLGITATKYVHECIAAEMHAAGLNPPPHLAHPDYCDMMRRPEPELPRRTVTNRLLAFAIVDAFHALTRQRWPRSVQPAVKLDFDEERAMDNPCRDPKCREQRLHVAHARRAV